MIDEKLNKLDELLNEYQRSSGLPGECPELLQIRGREILEMLPVQLKGLNAEECAENAVSLAQYGFYIQKLMNVETGRLHWCEENIRRMIGPRLKQQTAYAFKEREINAILEDEITTRLDTLRGQIQFRLDRISYLAGKIESVKQSFLELSQCKRRQNG